MFPVLRPPTIAASANIILSGPVDNAYAYSTRGPSGDQTIERHTKHLEDIVKGLEAAQGKTHIAVLQAKRKAREALDIQARQLSRQVEEVARKIEITATSGIHVSAIGVALLLIGLIFGGAAPELQQLVRPEPSILNEATHQGHGG